MILLLSLLVGFCPAAHASVTPFFSQDGNRASLVMTGIPTDPDAVALWTALAIPAEDFQGRWVKKLSLDSAPDVRAFDIDCIFSKLVQTTGTCTVILRNTPDLIQVDAHAGSARMWLTGAMAAKFAALFSLRDDSTILFRSQNGRLNITVARDRGVVTDLVVDWK